MNNKLLKVGFTLVACALGTPVCAESDVIKTRVYKVAEDFKSNRFVAKSKYKGKTLHMTGLVVGIEESTSGLPIIKFSNGSRAIFLESELANFSSVKNREYATVSCNIGKVVDEKINFLGCKVLPFDDSLIEVHNDWKDIFGL